MRAKVNPMIFQVAPTETGVVKDARAVYEWVAARYPFSIWIKFLKSFDNSRAKGQLIVWGHSLGTAVSSHLVTSSFLISIIINFFRKSTN